MPWIEVNGVSLRYTLSGVGNQMLVLVHEAGGCLESYDECMPALEREFRVLRYDQRGLGFSEKVSEMNFDTVVADLAALLDALHINTPVYVAGCALGGDIALNFAARYPERIAKLIIASPRYGAADAATLAARKERATTLARDGVRGAMAARHERSYPESLRALDRERFRRYQSRWVCNDPTSLAALWRMMSTLDHTQIYAKVKIPTLVIGATLDPMRTPAMATEVAAAIPNGKFVLAQTGHFMALQTPQVFVDTLLPFLKDA